MSLALCLALGSVAVGAPASASIRTAVGEADDGKAKKAKKAKTAEGVGTATITIDGTTWNATADKGGCSLGKKIGKGVTLRIASFTGRADSVTVKISANPASPRTSQASVRGDSSDPWWDSTAGKEITVKGRTASGVIAFISPIKDAEAVAARRAPQSYEGTFSFTC